MWLKTTVIGTFQGFYTINFTIVKQKIWYDYY